MHDGDRLLRQLGLRVELDDGRVVPSLHFAQEYLAERRPIERDVAALEALEVDHRHHAAHDGRELDDTDLLELIRLQRHVGGAEGHGAGGDLLDAAAGPDRLIVQPAAGFPFVGVRPLGIDRIRECRAGAGNIDGDGGICDGSGDRAGGENCLHVFHSFSPVMSCPKARPSRVLDPRQAPLVVLVSWDRDADTFGWAGVCF